MNNQTKDVTLQRSVMKDQFIAGKKLGLREALSLVEKYSKDLINQYELIDNLKSKL